MQFPKLSGKFQREMRTIRLDEGEEGWVVKAIVRTSDELPLVLIRKFFQGSAEGLRNSHVGDDSPASHKCRIDK